jgi:drug/metabolite transporter (DMT)-like permease
VLPYGLSLAPAGPQSAALGAAALAVALLYVAGELGVYAAIARGPASIVNPLAGLYPIPAIAYGALVIGDVPDRLGWIAIAIVLPGMVLAVPGALAPLARCRAPRPAVD